METKNPSEPFAAWLRSDSRIEYRVAEIVKSLEYADNHRFRYVLESRCTVPGHAPGIWSTGMAFFQTTREAMGAILARADSECVVPLTEAAECIVSGLEPEPWGRDYPDD